MRNDQAAPRLTREEYEEAIGKLQDGLKQLEPDGHPCFVCHDSGHQAWECQHNPLVIAKRYEKLVQSSEVLHDFLHEVLY